jgi:cyclophilin family peptidyl-prolyl cis-trans isomerase
MEKKSLIAIVVAVVIVIILAVAARGNKAQAPTTPTDQATTQQQATAPTNTEQQAKPSRMNQNSRPVAILSTNMGVIRIELFSDMAPNTVENFRKLSGEGFYTGTRFHRVIAGFMIQGGDPQSKDTTLAARWGTGGPGYTFDDEIYPGNSNEIGTISMANAGPNTNGSQFFINVADNSFLNTKHTVFGKVIDGMDVVNKIATTATGPNDRPVTDMIIESIAIQQQ